MIYSYFINNFSIYYFNNDTFFFAYKALWFLKWIRCKLKQMNNRKYINNYIVGGDGGEVLFQSTGLRK